MHLTKKVNKAKELTYLSTNINRVTRQLTSKTDEKLNSHCINNYICCNVFFVLIKNFKKKHCPKAAKESKNGVIAS